MKPLNRRSSRVRPSNDRAKLVTELSAHLWDDNKPEGEQGVPEDQWEEVLMGPCNGDLQLIKEVCAYERFLRREEKQIEMRLLVQPEYYERFLTPFFFFREKFIYLLAKGGDWYPEETWDERLAEWTTDEASKERLKSVARKLKTVKETGVFHFNMPLSGVFGP